MTPTRTTRDDAPTEKRIDELYDLIEGIEVAMLVTHAVDGTLVARPMQTLPRTPGADLWFMTTTETGKVEELRANPEVNACYFNPKSREWVSVSGRASLNHNVTRIRELYRADWKAWLPDEGGGRNGGPDDPRIVLIEVDAHSATWMTSDTPRVVALFKVARAMVAGETPDLGTLHHAEAHEIRSAR
jgi:general stress protein 26